MTSSGLIEPERSPIKLAILGSTGSIGRQALEVAGLHPDRLQVVAVAAFDEVLVLAEQAVRFNCQYVGLANEDGCERLRALLPDSIEVFAGHEGVCYLSSLPEIDVVLVAISGAAGIMPTVSAIRAGKRVALATKEVLVAAGDQVMKLAQTSGTDIIPVDSEHSAVFQCLRDERRYLKNIWLTASGGPFRGYSKSQLNNVTPQMALAHPNWSMGPKITVDSATLVNKGLEVIEAHHLFNVDYDRIKVVIHPQSRIHSLVEFIDGSFLAHMGVADMRIPIQYAVSYPERWASFDLSLDLCSMGNLSFEPPDLDTFKGLALALEAGKTGGTMPAVMNAVNEEAVKFFLQGRIGFNDIPKLIERIMEQHRTVVNPDLNDILAADSWARVECQAIVEGMMK